MAKYVADGKKQVPGALPDNAYDKSVIPKTGSFQKSPNSVVFGDVGEGLGDSIYEANIFVRGNIKSLGSDCIQKPMRQKQLP